MYPKTFAFIKQTSSSSVTKPEKKLFEKMSDEP